MFAAPAMSTVVRVDRPAMPHPSHAAHRPMVSAHAAAFKHRRRCGGGQGLTCRTPESRPEAGLARLDAGSRIAYGR
jgi:hypothetical protein